MDSGNATDLALLTQYRAGSQSAFAELVGRHIDWVYSAAKRRVRDAHLAEDVTQAVFLAIAKKCPISEGTIVSSWLFGVLRNTSANALRDQSRRRRHETAAAQHQSEHTTGDIWNDLAPLLEDAIARLRLRDRDAVIFRFYEKRSFAEVGGALGISEDTARKRVKRAIEKLQQHFAAKGVTVAQAALPGVLVDQCVQAAPSALTTAIAAGSAPPASALALFRATLRQSHLQLAGKIASLTGIAAIVLVATFTGLQLLTDDADHSGITPAVPAKQPSPVAQLAPATQPIATVNAPTYPTVVTLEQILAGLKQSEHAFQNLHIKNFQTTIDRLPNGQTQWVPTSLRFAGSAWYDADPLGSQRVYFSEAAMPWEGHAAPWVTVTDDSWDGHEGRTVQLAAGTGGQLMRRRMAWLSAGRPALLGPSVRFYTGAGFVLQYLVVDTDRGFPSTPARQPLSELIGNLRSAPGAVMEIVGQKVNGFDAVRLHLACGPYSLTYWFDPSRGFALVKEVGVTTTPGEGADVYEFKSVGPGVWFPMKAAMVLADRSQPGTYRRYKYQAADVIANDPRFDPSIFRTPIPSGCLVSDEGVTPSRLYVAMEDGSLKEFHGGAMPNIKEGVASRPDGDTPAILRDPSAGW